MKLRISYQSLKHLFFSLCVIIPFFNNYEISFILWLIVATSTIKSKYSKPFLFYLSHFITIFLAAFVVGLFFKYPLYFIIRDITYLLKPILGLIIGYNFFSLQIKQPFKFLVQTGVLMATIHLVMVIYGFIMGARGVAELRDYGGFFNDYEVYTLIILLFYKSFEIQLTKKQFRLYLTILAFSSFFYLARTNFIQFVILYLALKGYFKLTIKSLTFLTSFVVISILTYTAIVIYNPKRGGNGFDEFLYKLKLIPVEAFATKINRGDWKDFHDHYRSYENVRTIEQMSHNQTLFFGEGIGSRVDLKQKVYLGDMELRHISILHNGYMTVYLKSGVLGLIILLFSIFYFFKKHSYNTTTELYINRLFIGTGIFLFISYWVFMGFYNLLDAKSILIGFIFAFKNQLKHESSTH